MRIHRSLLPNPSPYSPSDGMEDFCMAPFINIHSFFYKLEIIRFVPDER